ncbi:MAG TPA: hypothetical protein VF258_06260 [Luteolibacter sp.]
MINLTTKHQRLAALRPLSPESVASLAAAWDVRMVASSDHFPEVRKMIHHRALDCCSLLPLSATQPAASRRGQQAGSRKAAAGCTQSKVPSTAPIHFS